MEGSDYNSIVYDWFEKSGIISNIRTQLRQNLIKALKGKDMALNKVNTNHKSAKQYIYDLLIAEYLWNHNYAYTLSVFASEAPLLVNFRKHVPRSCETTDTNDQHHKLQTDYVLHTLETMGVNPEDSDGQAIIHEYEKNDMPLLLTILKYTCRSVGNKVKKTEECNNKYFLNIATQTDTISHDFVVEKSKIVAARKKLLRQKDLYNSQLKERETELNKRAKIIEEQMIILNERLSQAHSMMQKVNAKERQIMEVKKEDERYKYRKKLLSAKEKSSDRENKRPEKEPESYQIFESNLKKLQEELAKVQDELSSKNKGTNSRVIINKQEVCTQTESNSLNNKLRADEEKLELQSLLQKQQLRIDELTLRGIRLSRQLEEAQLNKTTIEIMKPRVQISKSTTVFSESSSTDDIIQDAKQRLKRLEEESLKADQSYFNCMTNLPL